MDHTKPNLKIVDIREVERSGDTSYGRSVTTLNGELLGHVDGLVVDTRTGQPSHFVVNAGGWFTSKYFLLPVRSAQWDGKSRVVVADLSWEEAKNIPGFDKHEFAPLEDAERQLRSPGV